jgi:hypothetical protein
MAMAQTNQPTAAPAAAQTESQEQLPPDLEKLLQQPDSPERTKAIRIAARGWAAKDPVAVLSWAVKLPGPLKDQVGQAIPSVCAQANGKASADWSLQKDPNHWLLHQLVFYWAALDPVPATAWCVPAPMEVRSLAYFSVGDGWGMKDPAGAEGWAAKLEPPDDHLSAIRGIALRRAREKDLPGAAAWLKSLKPEDMMAGARIIVGDWHANPFNNVGIRNDAAIKAWLDQLPLNDAEKAGLLNQP